MKIKSVSESDILIKIINQNEFVAKINVKNSSEPSIKIYAGWYQRVRNFYKNRQLKRGLDVAIRIFSKSELRFVINAEK